MLMGEKRTLNWDDLRIFLEVARQGHLLPAARRLHIDHTTVSRRVAQLELTLDVKLFERTRTGLRLRDAGHKLLRHAEMLETQIIAAQKALGIGDGEAGGSVRIAMMEGIGSLYFASKFARLNLQHPLIKIELVTSAQPLNLGRREADLFISFFRPRGRNLRIRKIGNFSLGLYAAPAYLKRCGIPATAADLSKHLFIDYIDDLVAIDAVRWLGDVITAPQISFHSNSMIAQQHAAAAGLGIVLLPLFAAVGDKKLKPVLQDQITVERELWLSMHHYMHDIPRVRTVIDFIESAIAADQHLVKGADRRPEENS